MRYLVALLALVSSPALATDQFDLVCTSGKQVTRYRVDLASREWCWENCQFGTWRIADVTSTRITFKNDSSDRETVSNWVDRTTGRMHRFNRDRFSTTSSDGQCEIAPFSGFPKARF